MEIVPSATVLGLLLSIVLAASAHAQQASPPAQSPANVLTDQELAISVHNPFEDFVKVPIQSTTGFQLGWQHKVGDSLNIEPLLPFSLNADWDLMARPSLTVTYAPTPHEQSGLEDLQTSFFLTPAKETTLIWGVGPIFEFPSASSSELGTGKWSAGPTAAFVYSEGPWFGTMLTYQLMSFAGNHERGSVNQTYLEPDISYNFESGWYVQCDPAITYDWTADTANAWTIPMGADIGRAFKMGSQDLSLQAGAYDLLKRPDGAPQWIVRVSVTLLFPASRK
ncbi:MAG: transporter [Candidatus Binataceae bacterium]